MQSRHRGVKVCVRAVTVKTGDGISQQPGHYVSPGIIEAGKSCQSTVHVAQANAAPRGSVPPAPSWTSLQRNEAVRKLLAHLVTEKQFSFSDIKRAMQHYLLASSAVFPQQALGMVKPNGLHVREMFHPHMTCSGDVELPPGSHSLKIEGMDRMHIKSCPNCRSQGKVLDTCYFSTMRLCITHG